MDWVGHHQDHDRFELGNTDARARWCAEWPRRKVTEQRVSFGELKEALGRLVIANGPSEHLRPMLGPLFTWASSGPRHKTAKLPRMLLIAMRLGRIVGRSATSPDVAPAATTWARHPDWTPARVARRSAPAAG